MIKVLTRENTIVIICQHSKSPSSICLGHQYNCL